MFKRNPEKNDQTEKEMYSFPLARNNKCHQQQRQLNQASQMSQGTEEARKTILKLYTVATNTLILETQIQ